MLTAVLEGRERKKKIAVVAPHPGDETAVHVRVLSRYPSLLMVHITDGGPETPVELKELPTCEHTALRKTERAKALDEAGHTGMRVSLGQAGGRVAWNTTLVAKRLCDLLTQHRISEVFTLAYEGGHPDHDAAALAVRWAADRLGWDRENSWQARVIESPLYRPESFPDAGVWQSFLPNVGIPTFAVELTAKECDRKRRMKLAYASKGEIMSRISDTHEWYRAAPRYDFMEPPAEGRSYSELHHAYHLGPDNWRRQVRALLG